MLTDVICIFSLCNSLVGLMRSVVVLGETLTLCIFQ